jgi:ribonuclease BN (tRNA processing enzyme)
LGFQHEGGLSRAQYIDFCQDADLLLHDAQFTKEEYKFTRGWGHSTFGDAMDLAIEAGVKCLGLFHHDPDRTDDDLGRQVEFCQERIHRKGRRTECFATAEGMEINL